MQVYITEKPSVARALVDFFNRHGGNFKKVDKYFIDEKAAATVTWAYGHLMYLEAPVAYNPEWKAWKLDTLPLQPENFIFRKAVKSEAKQQYKTIKNFLKDATTVIHCGDPDREGQVLIDELLEGFKGDVQRILLNALDDVSIKRALDGLASNKKYKGLYEAGNGRAYIDWLVGMNFTRFFTIKAKHGGYTNVMRTGRVKSPTLNLIVQRWNDLQNFKEKTFWTANPKVEINGDIIPVKLKPNTHFENNVDALMVQNKLIGQTANVFMIENKVVTEAVTELYSLDTLQIAANKYLGLSAKDTLDFLQDLYEKKYVTYPRSDCKYLPESQFPAAGEIVKALNDKSVIPIPIPVPGEKMPKPFNDKKISAHHAIIPTTVIPAAESMNENQYDLYKLIVEKYVSMFFPDYKYKKVSIEMTAADLTLVASAKENIEEGFKILERKSDKEKNSVLINTENIEKGSSLKIHSVDIQEGKTTPPELYTEGSLIKAMNGISSDNKKLAAKLKEVKGIGTPATRANIISELLSEELIMMKKKAIIPTEAGIELINILPKEIKSADYTAKMEADLDLVQAGELSLNDVLKDTMKFIADVLNQNENLAVVNRKYPCPVCKIGFLHHKFYKDKETGESNEYYACNNKSCKQKYFPVAKDGSPKIVQCPNCGKGYFKSIKTKTGSVFYACSNYPECKTTMNAEDFDVIGKEKKKTTKRSKK